AAIDTGQSFAAAKGGRALPRDLDDVRDLARGGVDVARVGRARRRRPGHAGRRDAARAALDGDGDGLDAGPRADAHARGARTGNALDPGHEVAPDLRS